MSSLIIYSYVTSSGKVPFDDWIEDLDGETESKIRNRLNRIRLGNFGDCKPIKDSGGISELRIDYGPGYRVYIGRYKTTLVVLLMGGDKGSQTKDITKAKNIGLILRNVIMHKGLVEYRIGLFKHLQDTENAVAYLNEALMDEDPRMFLLALKDVLEAQGGDVSSLSKETELSRQNLYRIFSKTGNPQLKSLHTILHAMGLHLSVQSYPDSTK